VLEIVSGLEFEISSWIKQPKPPSVLEDKSEHIHPQDSISCDESRTSLRMRSAVSSSNSTSSKARSAARKAAPEEKFATLKSLHQLEIEELKLQQRKAEIKLRAEIAEAEAERKIYEEVEASKATKVEAFMKNCFNASWKMKTTKIAPSSSSYSSNNKE